MDEETEGGRNGGMDNLLPVDNQSKSSLPSSHGTLCSFYKIFSYISSIFLFNIAPLLKESQGPCLTYLCNPSTSVPLYLS